MAKRKKKKTSKNNFFIPVIIVLIIVFAFVLYYFTRGAQTSENMGGNPSVTGGSKTKIGGFCKIDSECFLTYCKGQTQDCINATQMATYAKENCKTYSDWVMGNQDNSTCGCIQNACTLK